MPGSSGQRFLQRRYYTKEWLDTQSPSRKAGLSLEKEEQYRQAYCQLIIDVGQKINVPMWGVGTAISYCHRFYAVRSMTTNDRFIIAQAAFFLAFKVEEESKPLELVIKTFWAHRYRARAGRSEEMLRQARERINEERFMEVYKQCVLTGERALLYALSFDLSPSQQHSLLVPLYQECGWSQPEQLSRTLTQAAWNFMNDSLKTTVSLQAPAEEIACAVLVLTARLFDCMGTVSNEAGSIWQRRNIPLERLQGIIEQIVAIYNVPALAAARAKGQPLPVEEAPPDGGSPESPQFVASQ